jgi:ubiquinone/menaquinone biosynthesis C-methylase UbiE
MLDLARPGPEDELLDVACGRGLVSLAFASRVRRVTGVDSNAESLLAARISAGQRGIRNFDFQYGSAESLEFESSRFDIVTCRAGFDHFVEPEKALREISRTLKPSGRAVIYEFVAPNDPAKAALYQEIERRRDPSHRQSLSIARYEGLFESCGLSERGRIVTLLKRNFEEWMTSVGASGEVKRDLRERMLGTISGDRAGLAPRIHEGLLTFTHTCVAWLLVPGNGSIEDPADR